mmetsp:Transcript_38465/g.114228  ORF Transcript_38465/g.114228 Transcript_38465/m.114228 type:complete len:289 (-) Transcript_38465:1318-2184(-)
MCVSIVGFLLVIQLDDLDGAQHVLVPVLHHALGVLPVHVGEQPLDLVLRREVRLRRRAVQGEVADADLQDALDEGLQAEDPHQGHVLVGLVERQEGVLVVQPVPRADLDGLADLVHDPLQLLDVERAAEVGIHEHQCTIEHFWALQDGDAQLLCCSEKLLGVELATVVAVVVLEELLGAPAAGLHGALQRHEEGLRDPLQRVHLPLLLEEEVARLSVPGLAIAHDQEHGIELVVLNRSAALGVDELQHVLELLLRGRAVQLPVVLLHAPHGPLEACQIHHVLLSRNAK